MKNSLYFLTYISHCSKNLFVEDVFFFYCFVCLICPLDAVFFCVSSESIFCSSESIFCHNDRIFSDVFSISFIIACSLAISVSLFLLYSSRLSMRELSKLASCLKDM